MYVCTYVRTYVCMYVYMYVCMYVCMYVRMYVRMYVASCGQTNSTYRATHFMWGCSYMKTNKLRSGPLLTSVCSEIAT